MGLLDLDGLAGFFLIRRGKRLVEVGIELARRIVGYIEQRDIGGVGGARKQQAQYQIRGGGENRADHLSLHSARRWMSSRAVGITREKPALSQRNRFSLFPALQLHFATKSAR